MKSTDLVFGTSNKNKLKEIKSMLPPYIRLLSMQDLGYHQDLPEDQPTISGNAKQKSDALYQLCNKNCFAEDTGLVVDALDGAPGVYSARYAGPQRDSNDNMDLLLQKLEGSSERSARFITVIALHWEGGQYTFEGKVEGRISKQKQGTGGFGYDPIFIPEGYQKSFGELPSHIKNQMSHRARAVNKLISFLSQHDPSK